MNDSAIEYTEVTDDSFHHYIIPFDKLGEWDEFMETPEDELTGDVPDFAQRLDGGRLIFKDWRIV